MSFMVPAFGVLAHVNDTPLVILTFEDGQVTTGLDQPSVVLSGASASLGHEDIQCGFKMGCKFVVRETFSEQ